MASSGDWKEIEVKENGNVGTIVLNRPQRGNSITTTMGLEIAKALNEFESNPTIRVIVLRANGKFFCTGMDLGSANQQNLQNSLDSGKAGSETSIIFETIRKSLKPIISMVQGPVMAGGWGIFFSTDFRIVVKSAYFQMTEVKRGVVPALISAYITPQLGLFKTKQFMLTGEQVSASEMDRLGQITHLVENVEEMEKKCELLIKELVSGAPNAMKEVKILTHLVNVPTHSQNLRNAQQVFSKTIHSEEALYGISAFAQKQKPDWVQFQQQQQQQKSKL